MPETKVPYDIGPDPARRERIDGVVHAYETLMHRIAHAHAPEFLGVGVTMSQAKVLYLLQAADDLRMSEIATRLGVSLSTMSGVIDRLVDQGLLTRHDDPADRRQVVVRITDAGVTQLELFRELNAGQVRALLARIDDEDLAIVQQAVDILAAAAAPAPTPTTSALPLPESPTGGTPS